jgi:hypothetical protein
MTRISLCLPKYLYQRLLVAARCQEKSILHFVRVLIAKTLAADEDQRREGVFQAGDKSEGIGKNPISDASTTIDDVLYGENGAWKGDRGETGLWMLIPQKVSHDRRSAGLPVLVDADVFSVLIVSINPSCLRDRGETGQHSKNRFAGYRTRENPIDKAGWR